MNLAGGPAGVGRRLVEALCEPYRRRLAHVGKLLIGTVEVENQLSVRLNIGAAGLGDEARDALHAPGLGAGRGRKGTGRAGGGVGCD